MRILGLMLPGLLFFSTAWAKLTPEEYISTYKAIAISEMHQHGIPASITLAQGYLESGCGNSDLAVKAKNHFGIKCHSDWKGETFYIKDDDKNEHGELIESCFRVYKSAEESFVDHSEFLTGRSRYAFLFELRTTDYKGWAHGLQKAGYATNPKYADLLINIIERYELYNYDKEKDQKLFTNNRLTKKEVFSINEIPAVAYDGQMTIRELRDKYFTAEWQIYKYNDIDRKTPLKKGMIIYLKPKKRKIKKAEEVHVVQEGETMQYISQLRGIKLKKLYKLNLLEEGEVPAVGEQLSLNDKRAIKPKTVDKNLSFKYFTIDNEGELFDLVSKNIAVDDNEPVAEKNEIEKPDGLYHIVGKGETLMSIARAYNMSWQDLKAQNNLSTDNLEVGQELLIEPRAEAAIATENEAAEEKNEEKKEMPKEEEIAAPINSNAMFHEVQKGETLFSISRMYSLTVAEIMDLNKMSNPAVSEGTKIRVKK
ncbi:LysM peptidoglycan-binding domain-containing protein [bacterium]|nr:LysM peptidoglycan-binding domain-containing protein [bacterium]